MSQNGGLGRKHRKVPGAFEFWKNIKQEYKGHLIPKGTRAPGSKVSKRVDKVY